MILRCTAVMCTRYWKSLMKELCMWKSQRAGSKQRKLNFLIMLFDLSKLRRTQKRWMQSETDLHQNESRKYKSF